MSLISKLFLARPDRTTAVLSVLTSGFHQGDSKKADGRNVCWTVASWTGTVQPQLRFFEFDLLLEIHITILEFWTRKENPWLWCLMGPQTLMSQQIFILDAWCRGVCDVPSHPGHRSLGRATQPSGRDSLVHRVALHCFQIPKSLFVPSGSNSRGGTHSKTSPNFFCHHLIEFSTLIQILWCCNDCNFKQLSN